MHIMEEIEEEAKREAAKLVMNMMQRPGQLEKVEQYKRRITHKKASIEAQLKSAVQSKLDGVSVGLQQLKECLEDIKETSIKLDELEVSLEAVAPLCVSLQAVREEESRHSQYVTAMDSLKHIFTVPESVAKTKQWIGEGKLLHAHQCLSELERSRDELLLELHRLAQASHDRVMLKAYFEDVALLSGLLEKQVRLVLGRTLNTVRKEPTVIVTVLRLIEREEKRDAIALQQQNQSGFLPPGRPKKWRAVAFEVLEHAVAQRIEGTRVDERDTNKLWLVRYLELTRQLMLEDLRVVTTLCAPCFPPHYDIVNKYVRMYHKCLSNSLLDVIQNGLEGNEYVSLLSWILNTYPGPELMQHPDLMVDLTQLEPLLSEDVLETLQDEYLQRMESNYAEWMEKTLVAERAEWGAGGAPEQEPHTRAYHTHAPVIVFQMIDQNLQVTNTISKEVTFKALVLSMEQVARYAQMYRDEVSAFKNAHFADRSRVAYFTHYMITIVNNAEQLASLTQQTQRRYWPPGRHDAPAERKVLTLLDTLQKLRDEASQFLLDEAFLDLEVHFDDLFTPKWLQSSIPIDTVCVTLEDYFQDYNHLRDKNFEYVITEAQNLVCRRYVTALLSRRVTFRAAEDAALAAAKMVKEAGQIRGLFARIAPVVNSAEGIFELIGVLAEVLRCQDIEMLSLDLHGLLDKCPDITEDHLLRLLSLRGDLSRSEVKEKVSYLVKNAKPPATVRQKSIFSQIVFSDRLLDRLAL